MIAYNNGLDLGIRLPDICFKFNSIMLEPLFNMPTALPKLVCVLLITSWHHHDALEFLTPDIHGDGLKVEEVIEILVAQFLFFCLRLLLVDFLAPVLVGGFGGGECKGDIIIGEKGCEGFDA